MTRQEINGLFKVDLENGRLFWLRPPKFHSELVGCEAGGPRPQHSGKSYWIVRINRKAYRRGHIIFCAVHGRFPTPCLDHVSGDSLDDRPSNIREATITENAWNHKHRKRRINLPMGVRGLASGRFQARLGYLGTQLHLGSFDTPEGARAAYIQKRKECYGRFA